MEPRLEHRATAILAMYGTSINSYVKETVQVPQRQTPTEPTTNTVHVCVMLASILTIHWLPAQSIRIALD
jgi:hypothetical protein